MAKDDSVAKSGNQQLSVENKVESLIRVIRGQQVMLDRDLAELYGVETKRLNEQVKRNIERFPEDFMFQLTPNEFDNLKSQIATSKLLQGRKLRLWNLILSFKVPNFTLNGGSGGTIYIPYAFAEQGVAHRLDEGKYKPKQN